MVPTWPARACRGSFGHGRDAWASLLAQPGPDDGGRVFENCLSKSLVINYIIFIEYLQVTGCYVVIFVFCFSAGVIHIFESFFSRAKHNLCICKSLFYLRAS